MSSGAAVAAVPELLRDILLRLDIRTLLLAQRVHPDFRDAIQGDSSLLKKLFLAPASYEEAVELADEDDLACHRNRQGKKFLFNRLFGIEREIARGVVVRLGHVYHRRKHGRDGRTAHSSCSWTRMYLTQPPTFEGFELGIRTQHSALTVSIPYLFDLHNFKALARQTSAGLITIVEQRLGNLIGVTNEAADAGMIRGERTMPDLSSMDIDWERSSIIMKGHIAEIYEKSDICEHKDHVNCRDRLGHKEDRRSHFLWW